MSIPEVEINYAENSELMEEQITLTATVGINNYKILNKIFSV